MFMLMFSKKNPLVYTYLHTCLNSCLHMFTYMYRPTCTQILILMFTHITKKSHSCLHMFTYISKEAYEREEEKNLKIFAFATFYTDLCQNGDYCFNEVNNKSPEKC